MCSRYLCRRSVSLLQYVKTCPAFLKIAGSEPPPHIREDYATLQIPAAFLQPGHSTASKYSTDSAALQPVSEAQSGVVKALRESALDPATYAMYSSGSTGKPMGVLGFAHGDLPLIRKGVEPRL